MHFNSKLILTLLVIIQIALASVNDKCSGRTGICLKTDTCSQYGGQTFSGKCPSDPNDVKCCDSISCSADGKSGQCVFESQCKGTAYSGKCPGGSDFKCCVGSISDDTPDTTYNGPCSGGGGACINTNKDECDTRTVSGKCSGPNNVKCCVSGNKPSWYVNQNEHTKILCKIPGTKPVEKSVASSGCGIASLTMAISVLTKKNLAPEDLFLEAFKNGYYDGNGFSHEAINFVGKRHGVKINWTSDTSSVYNALSNGKAVIYNVGPESRYHFTTQGHYIFLYGCKKQNGVQKVYVIDPNGSNKYINVLFALKRGDNGIEVAKRGGSDFGIVDKQ